MAHKPALDPIAQLSRGVFTCWLLLFFSSTGFADDTMRVGAPKQVPGKAADRVAELEETSQSMQLNGEPPRMHPANLALRFGLEVADLAGSYAAITAVHYAISFKRIRWLLRR